MGQRAVGSVKLSFGLLCIPTKMYLTASSESVSFRMMSPKGNTVNQVLLDSVTRDPVERSETNKGYEYEKNKIVTFTVEEVKALASEKCETANIEEFVPLAQINPIHVEKTFYLAPEKGVDKSYLLLYTALKKKAVAAVAKLYSHGREHLVCVVAGDTGLLLHQMYYFNEIRAFDNQVQNVPLSDDEINLACKIIEHGVVQSYGNAEDKPELYRDNYIDRVNQAVQAKLSGKVITIGQVPAQAQGGSLADILQASLSDAVTKAVQKPAKAATVTKSAPANAMAKQKPKPQKRKAS